MTSIAAFIFAAQLGQMPCETPALFTLDGTKSGHHAQTNGGGVTMRLAQLKTCADCCSLITASSLQTA